MRRFAFRLNRLAAATMLLSLSGLAACGGGDDDGPTIDAPPGGGGDGGTADAPPAPPGSFTINFPDVTVTPGTENTQCVVLKVGNTSQFRVNQIQNTLSQASHHYLVYRVNDTVEQPVPFNCQPFTDALDPAKGSPIMITQKAEETLLLPTGVAFTFAPDQYVRLEMHYINPGDSDVVASATSTFIPIADADFQHEADFLFIGSPDINIPASSTHTLGPVFFKMPAMLDGSNFFGITGHEHQWGTNVVVNTADASGNSTGSVYAVPGWNWDEPATVYHDPAFQIPSGGGFQFTCDWNNQSGSSVGFGESANDEMCFFWAYYYPSKGAFVCFHTDQFPGGIDACCPGNPTLCNQLM